MSAEIEFKLRIARADIVRLHHQADVRALRLARPRSRRLISFYYDTPALALIHHGISLRVRYMSTRWYQSLKTAGSSQAGLHQRQEWEDRLEHGRPDLGKALAHDSGHQATLRNHAADLQPLFLTDVMRSEWQLQTPDAEIELALDVGWLRSMRGDRVRISEIELELKSGAVSELSRLARRLQSALPNLQPEDKSKAELGYALALQHAPA
ncbi:CYTH domain-containing protein [Pseudomethylobacillus aquaticus]|uniref:CYTH domain-containing protein n=1 Tax=Pseudomethylobacillus aquaticus TaxID=2676064 RepID=A0A3N0V078_9PROT|nr:CYTH domain-containing protein [Pseudomethylobacillus aquaticus]ROH86209.1 CYTH domain-containing protein [Pseudomethylobacillus aquaticus]